MTHVELLMSEMHRFAALYVVTLTAYYSAPAEDHEAELGAQSAASCAIRCIAETIATAHAWRRSHVDALRDVMAHNTSRRVNEHLEDVLAKLLALPSYATTEVCNVLPAA
jgi:hypothetical protein